MLTLRGPGRRLCDGLSRREMLHVGGLGLLGLALPQLLQGRGAASESSRKSRARSCILLFLMGGPPQHSTWDPKPDTPEQIRGPFKPIATNVPGIQIGELMPRLAQHADKLAILRAVSTDDNAHSSSGYSMMTGYPHQPTNVENANPGPPNNWPNLGGYMQRLRKGAGSLPAAVRLPNRIFNTDGSVWPGQDAGMLGRSADPWLLHCDPASDGAASPNSACPPNFRSLVWRAVRICWARSIRVSMSRSGTASPTNSTRRHGKPSICCARIVRCCLRSGSRAGSDARTPWPQSVWTERPVGPPNWSKRGFRWCRSTGFAVRTSPRIIRAGIRTPTNPSA